MKAEEILQKFPHKYTSDDVKAARQWLHENRKADANGVFASFEGGQLQKEQLRGGCHGSIGGIAPYGPLIANLTKNKSNPGYVYGQLHITKVAPELARRWFTWVLSSYWGPFYVDTAVDEALESGLLVPSTLPANLMQGCNIITRHNHEHPNSILLWGDLVDKGMSEDVAYLIVFCWGLTKQIVEKNMPLQFTQLGHNAVGQLTPSVLRNFLDRNYNNLIKPLYGSNNLTRSYGMSSHIPYDQGEKSSVFYGAFYGSPEEKDHHILKLLKFLNSFNKKEVLQVVSPFTKKAHPSSKIGPYDRPGGQTIFDHALEIEEWLRKEYQ